MPEVSNKAPVGPGFGFLAGKYGLTANEAGLVSGNG